MKTTHAFAAAAFGLALLIPAGTTRAAADRGGSVFDQVEVREMRAAKTGRRYRILIARPDGPAPAAGYPTVYVLDPDIMFGTVAEAVRVMARRRDVATPAIVIGIGYPKGLNPQKERVRDYSGATGSQETIVPGGGNAAQFLEFVANELKPDIAARFPVDPDRETLFGHSLGGHFTLYALINRPATFDHYIAASPSIWYENGLLAKPVFRDRLKTKLETQGVTARVLITVGEYEQAPDPAFPPQPPQSPQTLAERRQVDRAREYAQWLGGIRGIEARFALLSGLDHGTAIPAAVGQGVRFAFSLQQAPVSRPATPPTFAVVGGIPIPDGAGYLAMTAEARYAMRQQARALSAENRAAWNAQLKYKMDAGLDYDTGRRLHEERDMMDKKHGTKPID